MSTTLARLHALATPLVASGESAAFFAQLLAAACELGGADKASLQRLESESSTLHLLAQRGLGAALVGHFAQEARWPTDAATWAGQGRRVVTELEAVPAPLAAVFQAERIAAAVHTPLTSRAGEPLGLLSLYFSAAQPPPEETLPALDLVARLAADFMERTQLLHAQRTHRERLQCAAAASALCFFHASPDWLELRPLAGELSREPRRRATWLQDQVHPEDHLRILQALERAQQTGETLALQHRLRRRDGSVRWVISRAVPRRGEHGEILEWVGAVEDITERHEIEAELRRHQGQLEERVLERTAELDAVNGSLRDEIVERGRRQRQHIEILRRLASAQEDERRRISRELHDEIGQLVASLLLGLNNLAESHAIPAEAETLRQLRGTAQAIAAEVHNLAVELRPTALDDLGLVRALGSYAEAWSARTKICADFHASGFTGRLEPTLETALYRIVQEALNNVFKHARARQVSIILARKPAEVSVIVEDDGCGFDPERERKANRLGLLGMQERAALAGGELRIESSSGQGTTVLVRIPVG
jgi:signal transduction histidine kinase